MKVINEITEEFTETPEQSEKTMFKGMKSIMHGDITQMLKTVDERPTKLDIEKLKKENKIILEMEITYTLPCFKVNVINWKTYDTCGFYSKESRQAESLQITYKKHD